MASERDAPVIEPRRATAGAARWIAGVLLILCGFAKVNGSQFTVLDSELTRPMGEVGIWAVESDTRAVAEGERFARVFFEYNRAFMAVFRTASGADTVRHFELSGDGEFRVWPRWLDRGDLLMRGRYDPDGQTIDLELEETGDARLRLRRLGGPRAR